jgi:uncharacterized protein (DUF433 family)
LNGTTEGGSALAHDRLRFETPLYTVADAARIVDVPFSTLTSWAKGYVMKSPGRPPVSGAPVITFESPTGHRAPSIPFVGLAEAHVLAAIRKSGVPMQRIRPALTQLQDELGVEHALASRKLYTDGAELLFDYGRRHETAEGPLINDLVVVRNGQRVFVDVIREYLQRIQYGGDGYPELIRVPTYRHAEVVVDPTRAFGAPIFERGGSRVEDVLERFWADESIDDLADEFGVPVDQIEDVLRVASRRAA